MILPNQKVKAKRLISRLSWIMCAGLAFALLTTCGKDSPTRPQPPPEPPAPPPVQSVPTSVTISPSAPKLTAVGATVQLTASVLDQNGRSMTSAVVQWSSGNVAVVTVSPQGLVTAVGNGDARITARSGTASASVPVTVMQSAGSVVIEPSSATLMSFGETVQLSATVLDANGQPVADAAVTWSSSDASVATVSNQGLVTAVGNGDARITARSGTASANVPVTVMQSAGSVVIDPSPAPLVSLGETVQLSATVLDGNGQPVADAAVTWSSSDASVATVSNQGLVTAVGNGDARITARSGTASASVPVTVMQSAGSVVIEPSSATLMSFGETVQLSATVLDANGQPVADAAVTWSSSDASVATVSNQGLVTAVGNGDARITARSGTASANVPVTVMQSAGSVVIDPSPAPLVSLGETVQLSATVLDGNGQPVADAAVTWSSSDASVATVSNQGLVTAVGNGDARITARSGTASASVPVTVMQSAGSVVIEPSSATLMSFGETVQLSATVLDGNGQPVADAAVTWSSSDASVATVSNQGLVTAVGNGDARITARSGTASASVPVTVRNSDRDILVAIYNDTEGESWTNDTNWMSDASLERWYGVTVDSDGRVTALNLPNNNLRGSLPPSIVHLEALRSLQLNHNRLSGEILPELGELSRLEDLVLSSNLLTGSIPSELGQLSGLRSLVVSFNRLSGAIPPELGQLGNLESLSLSVNELTGPVPAELGRLRSLVSLRMDQNQLSGPIPFELGRLTSLERLELADNALTGRIPLELTALTGLEALFLDHNRLTGTLPAELGRLTRLKQLRLSGNALSGPLPPDLGRIAGLTHLRLFGNRDLVGVLPRSLTGLDLEELLVEGTKLCAPADADFQEWLDRIPNKNVAACANLEYATLAALYDATDGPNWTNDANWLSSAPVGSWHGIATDADGQVTSIDLEDNGLNGYLPAELAGLAKLRTLNLNGNELLSGPLPRAFTGLRLHTLSLEGTGLCAPSDAGFQAWIRSIPVRSVAACAETDLDTLGALFALFNGTNGTGWTDRTNWNSDAPLSDWFGVTVDGNGNVTELNLAGNNLSGHVPSALARLTRLKKIDFSDNEGLSGPLPFELTGLRLESLLLRGTQLCAPAEAAFQAWLDRIANDGPEVCAETRPAWFVLADFYNRTNGPGWSNNANWLSDRPFEKWYGVTTDEEGRVTGLELQENNLSGGLPAELGRLTNLRSLHLGWNNLSGPIPVELSQLTNLESLNLADNALSGPIPVELGQLSNLAELNLDFNDLSGALPPELGQMTDLESLDLSGNNLSGALPPELGQMTGLRSLSLTWNNLSGTLPPELGQMTDLESLDLAYNNLSGTLPPELGQMTDLESLDLRGNNLSGTLPPELGQMTDLRYLHLSENKLSGALPPELGQLEELVDLILSVNALSGRIPAELGRMSNLTWLELSSNDLSGSVPHELGRLTRLKTLDLASNPLLSGALPASMTMLPRLETLQLGGTALCMPSTPAFRTWLQSIQISRVVACFEFTGATAYLTQAAQSLTHPVPLVAGEAALLRVFVTADSDIGASMPPVSADFFHGGRIVHSVDVPARDIAVPERIEEGELMYSANAEVPGTVVRPGLEMVVNIDPPGSPGDESNAVMRIPETGRKPLDVRSVPPFNLTLVPFLWTESPQVSVLTETDGLSAEDELFWQTRNLLPIADFDLEVREPVWTSTDPVNSYTMLQETKAIRVLDGSANYYMGILRVGGGEAELPGTSSVSILDAEVIAHEIGHNLNLYHSPCGGAFGPDRNYPYGDGSIGSWGYDPRDGMLVPPDTADLMGYCHPQWISEYGFTRAIQYRGTEPPAFAAAYSTGKGLLIWGGVDESGDLVLQPSFAVDAAPSLPVNSGPYRLTGEATDGSTLFSLDFGMAELGDGEGNVFAFVVPVQPGWADRLGSISLTGPEGSAEIDREGDRIAALLIDRSTERVRGLLRNWLDPSGVSPRGRRSLPEPGLEITVSTGVPDPESW